MTTTCTITNPAERKAGDFYRIVFKDGAALSGDARKSFDSLAVGDRVVRSIDWHIDTLAAVAAVTVTREVEDIAEPRGFGAVVELGDGGFAVNAYLYADDVCPWLVRAGRLSSWRGLVRNYGVTRVVFEGVNL